MIHASDGRESVPRTAWDCYVGSFLPGGLYAIQEVENPDGWLISDQAVPPEA